MTVERISFPDGLLMATGENPSVGMANALSRGLGSITPMPAGEYDITPAQMTHNKYRYNLYC